MGKKQMLFKTKGMNKDLSVSAFNPEFSFDNRNLRLSTNEGNTMLSWVNERGTSQIETVNSGNTTINILGTTIGTAIINNKLILFTHYVGPLTTWDYIYKLEYNDLKTKIVASTLYVGDLGFSTSNPIETLVSYEADNVQKVYWVDGIHQPRVINIASDNIRSYSNGGNTQFDFVPTLKLREEIHVEKLLDSSGTFAPGVIQYAFTYYNKHGQESNVFYVTPLQYISPSNRGGAPDERINNAFKIVVEYVDTNFDYLRIYSIQRTSINGTPICKRIQDIATAGLTNSSSTQYSNYVASYTDTGTSGETIDPMELLYKGGEIINVSTLEQKDGTLFLGNFITDRESLVSKESDIVASITIQTSTRKFIPQVYSTGDYEYGNQLSAILRKSSTNTSDVTSNNSVPCGGFKTGDYYRLGVQFQHKSGKWSDPIHLPASDSPFEYRETQLPSLSGSIVSVPAFTGTLSNTNGVTSYLVNKGYVRVRGVVVFPELRDRMTLCQGVISPTIYSTNNKYQSSWFFRPYPDSINRFPHINTDGSVYPSSDGWLKISGKYSFDMQSGHDYDTTYFNPANIRAVEIQGSYDYNTSAMEVDRDTRTFHSPDIAFDDQLFPDEFSNVVGKLVGHVTFSKTLSDISIQTETPTASSIGGGFVKKSFTENGNHGIVSGLFFDDFAVGLRNVDNVSSVTSWKDQQSSYKWMVYLWNKSGSLNNDFNRPSTLGTPSAVLKKKIVSNLRYTTTAMVSSYPSGNITFSNYPKLFSSDENTVLKIGNTIYRGNVDTLLIPDASDGMYFAFEGTRPKDNLDREQSNSKTEFTSTKYWKFDTFIPDNNTYGDIWKWSDTNSRWERALVSSDIGQEYLDLYGKRDGVRMKYKSTPHLVLRLNEELLDGNDKLAILDIARNATPTNLFGGRSKDALRENNWIPCGEPVSLVDDSGTVKATVVYGYDYGDTYFQRYDCLKTYAYTNDDINQVVEIGSFMLESHINIDGRYDRNRGQHDNLYMSPRNFNLLNPVYSQVDNFFTYKIQDPSYYDTVVYPNQVTWSKTKENGADIDLWTNVTLASILELDGDKGSITSLQRFNDQLIAFQDSGISQILYNENVQIQSTEGVPIELANSGKVQGKRYISDTVGCSNKWSIVSSPAGLYFMDSVNKGIFLFNGQLDNISLSKGFDAWCKKCIPDSKKKWTPLGFENFVGYYDRQNQDVLYINSSDCLAYSEKMGAFTSFYDYGNVPYFCNLEDTGVWVKPTSDTSGGTNLWKHQGGDAYCKFFGVDWPYWMVLVGNPEPLVDKTFTNLEFRANVVGDGEYDGDTGKFTPALPFDSLETWNEYQHGYAQIGIRNGHDGMVHHINNDTGAGASLKRKFRIWRCDIPRDNCVLDSTSPRPVVDYGTDASLGISRYYRKPMDRMRNTWVYLKLMKKAATGTHTEGGQTVPNVLPKAEVHDVVMTYFG